MPLKDSPGERDVRDFWRIDGKPITTDPSDEVRTFNSLEITFRVPKPIVVNFLRPLQSDAGQRTTLEESDGGFTTIDTADGANTHTIEAPSHRKDVRRQMEWVVESYDETLLDQTGEKFEVELELFATEEKRLWRGHVDEEPVDSDWLLELDAGDIATRELDPEIISESDNGAEAIEISLYLDPPQTRKIEESFRKLAATRVREEFDGSPVVEDNSPNQTNTFYLRPPAGGEENVERGYYICRTWESERVSDGAYQVTIEAVRNARKSLGFGRYFGRHFGTGPEHESDFQSLL